jgi:hypothetical protein
VFSLTAHAHVPSVLYEDRETLGGFIEQPDWFPVGDPQTAPQKLGSPNPGTLAQPIARVSNSCLPVIFGRSYCLLLMPSLPSFARVPFCTRSMTASSHHLSR